MSSLLRAAAAWIGIALLFRGELNAESFAVPGASFESPVTTFVDINIDYWQKAPKPPDYDESGDFTWVQLAGTFRNTPPGASDHIDNCHGNQAIWMFVVPGVALFQDYDSVDWNSATPPNAFNVRYEIGKAYKMTVGIIGSGGNMQEGASLAISLYYRDTAGNKVTVASAPVVYTEAQFPNNTHLVDCSVEVPVVKGGDAWAGKHIGIQLLSTVTPGLEGGYWDLDNVRLSAVTLPTVQQTRVGGNVQLSWFATTGTQYQVERGSEVGAWQPFDAPINGTGATVTKLYPINGDTREFFRVRATAAP